jgi:hypothetical protein
MFFVQNDDVVQAFPTEGTDQAFGHGILPRSTRGNEFLFQAQALDSVDEIGAIDGISIPEQITGVSGGANGMQNGRLTMDRAFGWRRHEKGRRISPPAQLSLAFRGHGSSI